MAHLNIMKMLGLILLLVIALTLPTILPQSTQAVNQQISTPTVDDPSNA